MNKKVNLIISSGVLGSYLSGDFIKKNENKILIVSIKTYHILRRFLISDLIFLKISC